MNSKKHTKSKQNRLTTTEQKIAGRQAAFLSQLIENLEAALPVFGKGAAFEKAALQKDLLGLLALRNEILPGPPLPLQFERKDLRDLLRGVLKLVQISAEQKGVVLEYIEKTNQDPAYILLDSKYIYQAFHCLMENAIRFSNRGQTIRLALMKSHTEYVVEILDKGCGIDSADLAHVFKPYYSLVRNADGTPGALGLGLTYAKKIVEQHSAILDIRSKPDRGTVTFLHFPSA